MRKNDIVLGCNDITNEIDSKSKLFKTNSVSDVFKCPTGGH